MKWISIILTILTLFNAVSSGMLIRLFIIVAADVFYLDPLYTVFILAMLFEMWVLYINFFKKFVRHDENNPDMLELKEMPIDEAKPLIMEYVRNHPCSWTSEIAEALGIDYIVTNEALHELNKEGILD